MVSMKIKKSMEKKGKLTSENKQRQAFFPIYPNASNNQEKDDAEKARDRSLNKTEEGMSSRGTKQRYRNRAQNGAFTDKKITVKMRLDDSKRQRNLKIYEHRKLLSLKQTKVRT